MPVGRLYFTDNQIHREGTAILAPANYFASQANDAGRALLEKSAQVDDDEIAAVLREAYLYIAPTTLARQLLGA
jgi:hypothetical protein